jgi:hypothetical protein
LKKEYILYALPLVVLLFNRIPYLGKYLRVVNTLIHESGHALMALLMRGEVYEVELFSNRAGTATTKTKGKFRFFMVAFAGYPVGSAFAWLMFYFISKGQYSVVLYSLATVSLLNLTFLVRNTFGLIWLVVFVMLVLIVKFYGDDMMRYIFCAFITGIMLFEALYSSVELITLAFRKSKSAGDAAILAQITRIPAMFWAIIFFLISLLFIYLSIKLFFPI